MKSVASFSPLTSQEYQYILDQLKLGNIRVRLGSVLDYEDARIYPAENKPKYLIRNYSIGRPLRT